jgi:hypothetical protein
MKDSGTALRTAYFNALSGLGVPVVDGKVESLGSGEEYIVLSDQSDEDRSNKSVFVTETTVQIDIYTRKKSVSGKKVVEDISNDVMDIILPTPSTHGLTIASPFLITYVKIGTGRAQAVKQVAANGFENIKTLQFKNRITQ